MRVANEKKAQQAELLRLARVAAQNKKEEQARQQLEMKEKKIRETKAIIAERQAKRDDRIRQQLETKEEKERGEMAIIVERQAQKDEQARQVKRDEQLKLQLELKERTARAEDLLRQERKALEDYKAKRAEETRKAILSKEKAKEESRIALALENETISKRVAADKADREQKVLQLIASKAQEEASKLAAKRERDSKEDDAKMRQIEQDRLAVVMANTKRLEDARAAAFAKELEAKKAKEQLMLRVEAEKRGKVLASLQVKKEVELQQETSKRAQQIAKMDRKWSPDVAVGGSAESLPWLGRVATALNVQAIINRAREANRARGAEEAKRKASEEKRLQLNAAEDDRLRSAAASQSAGPASDEVELSDPSLSAEGESREYRASYADLSSIYNIRFLDLT